MDPNATNVNDLVHPVEHPLLKLVARSSIYSWLRSGRLKSIRLGNRWFCTNADIENFVKSCSVPNEDAAPKRHKEFEAAKVRMEARRQCSKGGGR